MTSIGIDEDSIPDLTHKVALITGGGSGIGFAAAKILLSKNATVHVIDINEPSGADPGHPEPWQSWEAFHFHRCDITSWAEQLAVFDSIGRVDMVFANAGAGEQHDDFAHESVAEGREPSYAHLVDVNLIGTLHTVTLARRSMRQHAVTQGSVVITISALAYAPEQSLPVYTASKIALVGLVRSLRSTMLSQEGITINGVAPAATITNLLPPHFAAPIVAMGLPTSEASFVGRALVYAATAKQDRRVEVYGKESDGDLWLGGAQERWNGRVILTLGDAYTELESSIADLRPYWFGQENLRLTRAQQAATDFRNV
ncbi:NAD(P)-binding protein [Annulohypoxylon truncatum]|uniref:NAD(P)-binding protein n=1 Tax=Annulohypoxylon truncatum TaxID=327061 RepID=UPI002007E682|nr:NAD(P)-binding protein [Annulohypoxylon truncatum]KAI1206779.1 NAD(P)-binding protein [Annulohypoxylon truncatum]